MAVFCAWSAQERGSKCRLEESSVAVAVAVRVLEMARFPIWTRVLTVIGGLWWVLVQVVVDFMAKWYDGPLRKQMKGLGNQRIEGMPCVKRHAAVVPRFPRRVPWPLLLDPPLSPS